MLELLAIVAACDYAGAPDLVLFTAGAVEMTEVKSSSDSLRPEQARCLRRLERVAPVAVCCLGEVRQMEKRCRPSAADTDSD